MFPPLVERLRTAAPDARIDVVYGSTEAEPVSHLAATGISPDDLERIRAGGGLPAGPLIDEIELAILPNRWGEPSRP